MVARKISLPPSCPGLIGPAADPAGKEGLANLLSTLLDEGAGPYGSEEFQRRLNDNAVSLGFDARADAFYGSLKTLNETRGEAVELLRLAVSEPRFDDDAVERILRVPAGFMRQRTQTRVEELAAERAVATIDLGLVEDGIEAGRRMMAEMIAGYQEARADAPATSGNGKPRASGEPLYLNEVGLMSALDARRRNGSPSDS